MNKGTHFLGQPMYGQLISLLDKAQILRISQENGGERYVKHFDAWQHLVVMLYAVVKRFDSLREIVASMLPEARKLGHLGINSMPRRSTLSDANLRRNECIFEAIYGELYATYKHVLSADSRRRGCPKWIERLRANSITTPVTYKLQLGQLLPTTSTRYQSIILILKVLLIIIPTKLIICGRHVGPNIEN